MVKTILINSSNVSSPLKNQYTYRFVGGGLNLDPSKKHYVAVSSVTIPYSFFNISSIYNNKRFSIIYNNVTYNLELPDSFMTVDDMNKFFQWWFIQNNMYTLDSFGNYVYYMELEYNVSRYAVEVICYPTALPDGGTNPKNMVLNGNCMQLYIDQSNANFGKLIGLAPGLYPQTIQTTTTSTISNITVEGSPVQALNLTCNIVNNSISTTPDTFYAFTPSNASFGSNISLVAPELVWVETFAGQFQNLVISIKDQEGRDIHMRDSSICVMVCLKSE